MHFGASMYFTDYSMTPPELATELEARGFESRSIQLLISSAQLSELRPADGQPVIPTVQWY